MPVLHEGRFPRRPFKTPATGTRKKAELSATETPTPSVLLLTNAEDPMLKLGLILIAGAASLSALPFFG